MKNQPLHCLIVEDEPLAADILEDYIRQVPFLKLIAICGDSTQALNELSKQSIDLIFLDIHLPGLKGLDFLDTLPHPPKVIITTAYHEYALKSYEHSIVDYLLKPIEFKRFLQAVNKLPQVINTIPERKISIHSDKKTQLIAEDEIVFVESQREYIHIHTSSRVYISKMALSKIEAELPGESFLRIHRSFIISLKHIQAFNSQEVELNGKSLPIGGNYQQEVAERLKSLIQ